MECFTRSKRRPDSEKSRQPRISGSFRVDVAGRSERLGGGRRTYLFRSADRSRALPPDWMSSPAPSMVLQAARARSAKPIKTFTRRARSEEHTPELQSLMRSSYAVFFLKTKNTHNK